MLFPRLTPFVRKVLIALFSFYVLELILQNWVGWPIFEILALDPASLSFATLWQVWTYPLVAPSAQTHVLFVLIGLLFFWWIVAPFEERYGAKRSAQLCLVATISAALPALAVAQFLPQRTPLYGVGPITLAAIAAFAYSIRSYGNISLFGAVSMRPMHVVYVVLGLSGLYFLASGNLIELVADLGAVAGGILFILWMSRPRRSRRQPAARSPFSVVRNDEDSGKPPHRWLN